MTTKRTPRIAIIGAGMSGIGMAARLQRAGIESFHLYERHPEVGGTWHANTYPGLYCDVPSRNYQYTFAPNPDWSRLYSPGREIWAYIDQVARDHDVHRRISFNTEVTEATWKDGHWTVRTDTGEQADYDFIITATGGLVRPRRPDIKGLDTFEGAAFHSAEWDHSVELAGKRVAVIGTGSTGMQLTKALAPVAEKFELYQRTPQWILPTVNFRYSPLAKVLQRRFPFLRMPAYRFWQTFLEGTFGTAVIKPGWQRTLLSAMCRLHLLRVRDRDLRRRYTPDYKPMCKRLVMGSGFYGLFSRSNTDLVDTPIDHIEPRGIVTEDGELHELDVIVLATGFDAQLFVRPIELVGPEGNRLSELWADRPFGYRSVGLPGFPNVFMLIGPHSPFGNQSLFTISETQAAFALRCIEQWRRGEFDAMAPTHEATEQFNAELREAMPGTIWASGCTSWYIGADGQPSVWPWRASHHREILQQPEPGDWELQSSSRGSADPHPSRRSAG